MNAPNSTPLTPEEEFVKAVLEQHGATVNPIPRANERTPDFNVQLAGAEYTIEVKAREEAELAAEEREEALARGDVHAQTVELRRNRSVSRFIESGVGQLRQHEVDGAFRILWFHCPAPHGERHKYQLFNALYGATRLYDYDDNTFKVDGLYFRSSDFHHFSDVLDGAVVTMDLGDDCQLFCFANDHSPKYDAFRVSPLATAFPIGFFDPVAAEASGDAIVIRGEVDRRNEGAVLNHLHQVTGRRLFNMDFNQATAMIAVPLRLTGAQTTLEDE